MTDGTVIEPVPTKPTKAIVAAVVSAVTIVATGVEALIPDPTVKLVCQLVTLVVGAIGTVVGVYQTTNAPK
jgi:hypothetical protein